MSDPVRVQAALSREFVAVRPPVAAQAASPVHQALEHASKTTGVDFDYLLAQATLESGLDADAKARTSSATGLFQFIDSTWLETMHRHGESLGLGRYAAQISTNGGRAKVADPAMRGQILALRNDPKAASLMAAALAEDNKSALMPVLGREPDANELYLAHFMGSGGAAKFLRAMQDDPQQSAAAIFPRPAAANRAIFYSQSGRPRSLSGVMQLLSNKMERAMTAGARVAEAGPPKIAFQHLNLDQDVTGSSAGKARNLEAVSSFRPGPSAQPAMRQNAQPEPGFQSIPMSTVISQGFGFASDHRSPGQAAEHARSAYLKLKAFGL